MIKGIEHIAILSPDTARLCEWYQKTLGFRKVFDSGDGAYFVAAPNGVMFELITQSEPAAPAELGTGGFRHIALTVDTADFEADAKKLTEMGVDVISPPRVNDQGVGTFFFRDPDGNVLHLICRPKPLV